MGHEVRHVLGCAVLLIFFLIILGAVDKKKLHNATIHVCPFVIMEQLGLHWADFWNSDKELSTDSG